MKLYLGFTLFGHVVKLSVGKEDIPQPTTTTTAVPPQPVEYVEASRRSPRKQVFKTPVGTFETLASPYMEELEDEESR